MKVKAMAVAIMAAVLAMSFVLVVTPDADAYEGSDVVAIGDAGFASLSAALEKAENGATIKLIGDVTEDVVIPSGKNIVLDLNGFKLTNSSSDTILVQLGATITIKDTSEGQSGKVDCITHGKAALFNNGNVTIESGTFDRSLENGKDADTSGGNSYYTILNHGVLTVNGGTIRQNGQFSSLIDNGYSNYTSANDREGHVESTNVANPTLTINGGSFANGKNTVKNDDGATLVINGGSFSNYAQTVIQNHNVATINDGTFVAGEEDTTFVIDNCGCGAEYDLGTLTINGGTFTGNIQSRGEYSHITINGGTFTGDLSFPPETGEDKPNYNIGVFGGAFNGMNVLPFVKEGGITLNGKIALQTDSEVIIPEGVDITGDAEIVIGDYLTVKGTFADGMLVADAKVGDIYCATVSYAIAKGGVITLLKDVDCVQGMDVGKVDLNGFSILHRYSAPEMADGLSADGAVTAEVCSVCGYTFGSTIANIQSSDLVDAFGKIEGYEPIGTASVTDGGVALTYEGSYTGTDVMNDVARFLGVLHNTGKVERITYGGIQYTWNSELGNKGSNWAHDGTSLVSVLVKDFNEGRLTDKVELALDADTVFSIGADAEFVASDGKVAYSKLQDAVRTGGHIELLSDVTEDVIIDRAVSIDGNGKKLVGSIVMSASAVDGEYEVDITDLTIDGKEEKGISSTSKVDRLSLSKVSVSGFTDSVSMNCADTEISESTFDAPVKIFATALFEVSMDSLEFSIPGNQPFVMRGNCITVTEASVEGTVPGTVDVIVTSKVGIPAGKSVNGTIWFDAEKGNGISMSSVVAGTSGVTLKRGSVEIVGDFTSSEGTITVTGIARIIGDSNLDGVELVVPKGSSLTIGEGASVTGTGSISNSGVMKIQGSVDTAVDNPEGAEIKVGLTGRIDSTKLTGDGEIVYDSIIIDGIGTKYCRVGDRVDIPITVDPADARLTLDYTETPVWLSIIDGHIVGTVAEKGSFSVTVKASMDDRATVSESFVILAVPAPDSDVTSDDDQTTQDFVKTVVLIVAILFVVLMIARAVF